MFCLRALQAEQPPASVDADATQPVGQHKSGSHHVGPSKMSQVSNGWAPQPGSQNLDAKSFQCPVCHRSHALDLEALNVDKHICAMADTPSSVSSVSTQSGVTDSLGASALSVTEQSMERESSATADSLESLDVSGTLCCTDDPPEATLVPPQAPRWTGKLSIVLDLDGTLIASFPPRRAPALPPHVRTHLVGKGSSLNPQGVAIVACFCSWYQPEHELPRTQSQCICSAMHTCTLPESHKTLRTSTRCRSSWSMDVHTRASVSLTHAAVNCCTTPRPRRFCITLSTMWCIKLWHAWPCTSIRQAMFQATTQHWYICHSTKHLSRESCV